VTPIFGPGWGNYAIRGIAETAVPDPVSLVPQTPGWWLLLALALAGAAHWIRRRVHDHRRNRYRREALTQLQRLQRRYRDGDQQSLRELAPLLRATAMQALGNRELANTSGKAWEQALGELAPGVSPPPVRELNQLAYAPLPATNNTPESAARVDALFAQLRRWIECHELADA
jgi:MYXO-CTERM domain-containing protein